MILVLLGTQDKSFHRLLEQIDKSIVKGTITEEVIVQAGHTKYSSPNMKIFDFVSKKELEEYVEKSSLIITHAGVGSILDGIRKCKKMIVAPRLKKYKEHTNDHQLQILKEFGELGYILPLYDFSSLDKLILKSKKFKVKKYQNTNQMINLIADYIDKNVKDVRK
ncbi:MAG: exopolysaccharide biosynthesis protein [Bacilli bacterium]|nr:exopolysaccharide biosynthesis protein [Bacilli bacterium]